MEGDAAADGGPVGKKVAARLVSDLRHAGINVRLEDIRVERLTTSRLGEFRFDAAPSSRASAEDLRGWTARLAGELSRCGWISRATAVPPRVYLQVETDVLYSLVVETVLAQGPMYGAGDEGRGEAVLVCYCSPNANKPLHIGHLRVNVLGMAISHLLAKRGVDVMRTEMLSNYGIHVCQALAAYELWGNGHKPAEVGKKGDHFVGEYYVLFHSENAKQRALLNLEETTDELEEPDPATPLEQSAAQLLQAMERGDQDLLRLNERFTRWAVDGIRDSYRRIGSRHELVLFELDTLPLAKQIIREGLSAGNCLRRADGSLYIDVPGLGPFTILRRDATPLVYTQLLGIWVRRRQLAPSYRVMHVTGRQWEAGVAALLELLRVTGHEKEAEETEAVFYGMVRVPEGKIRSRHGTVLALDGFLDRMRDRFLSQWASEMHNLPMQTYRREVSETLAIALVKLAMLRVRRARDIVFVEEDVWRDGVARLRYLIDALRVADKYATPETRQSNIEMNHAAMHGKVRELLLQTDLFPTVVARAAARREPAEVARFLEGYAERVLACERLVAEGDPLWRCARLVLRSALSLLNVELPASLVYLPDPFAETMRAKARHPDERELASATPEGTSA